MERNDDTLRRTMSGNLYRVKGYVMVSFDEYVKAIDVDEADDIVEEMIIDNYYYDGEVRVVVDEVIIQEED